MSDKLVELYRENEKLKSQIHKYQLAINAVQDLIDNSEGVSGLHLNGDIAEWHTLLEGGRFEEWLYEFSICEEG